SELENFLKFFKDLDYVFIGPIPSRSLKAQLRLAEKLKLKKVVLFIDGKAYIKNMEYGRQEEIKSLEKFNDFIK
ncbi:MAG: hypothetical protein NZ870_05020, partial [bacterium]|nr:hypothetical protein [bacterium]